MVEAAAGHEVTLFNRGEANPELFPGAEKLRGDRGGELEALRGRSFDACIDVNGRDLGGWIVRLCEERTAGAFNAIRSLTRGEVLDACSRATGSDTRLRSVPSGRLARAGVGGWMELPLWIGSQVYAGMMHADNRRAVAGGLTFRPLEETVRGALEQAETVAGVGLAPERERELLA